jgi:hypothetical protein
MRIEIIIDVVSNESQYAMICERGGHILDIKNPSKCRGFVLYRQLKSCDCRIEVGSEATHRALGLHPPP